VLLLISLYFFSVKKGKFIFIFHAIMLSSTVGDRAFPDASARTWNDLPRHVTSASSLPVFQSRLKTHLFRRSFP